MLTDDERLDQTIQTVESLRSIGIADVRLADNSGKRWILGTEDRFPGVTIYRSDPFQMQNKGINELQMLIDVAENLPPGIPILKISGRYRLAANITHELGSCDFAARILREKGLRPYMHTSCYIVRNRDLFKDFLMHTLYEQYAYYSRIVGLRSLARITINSLAPRWRRFQFMDPPEPIEFAAAQALLRYRYRVKRIPYVIAIGKAGANQDTVHVH